MNSLLIFLLLSMIYKTYSIPENCPEIINRICVEAEVPSLHIKPYLWFANKCFFERTKIQGSNNFASMEIVSSEKCEKYDSCDTFRNTCQNLEVKPDNLQCVSAGNGIDFFDFQNTCEVLGWQCFDEILVFVGMGTCNSTRPFQVVN